MLSRSSEFAAIYEGSALGEIAPGAAIGLAGRDRATFLQGLLTNDIVALGSGTGCYAAWLTPQGRMLTDLHVLESGEMLVLDVPRAQHAATLERLERFLFSEDVQIRNLDDALTSVWLHGPRAPALVEGACGLVGLADWQPYRNARAVIDGQPVVVARIDQVGVPGVAIHVAHEHRETVERALTASGAVQVSPEALDAARIDAGYPLFGVDMTGDTIPLEAGLDARAISRAKGCYVGQEVIVRVLDRGHGRVVRRLVVMTLKEAVPEIGAKAFAGDREVGWITSAATSRTDTPIALGYLHRDLAVDGAQVSINTGERRLDAAVRNVVGTSGLDA